jgi:hypothetical protein
MTSNHARVALASLTLCSLAASATGQLADDRGMWSTMFQGSSLIAEQPPVLVGGLVPRIGRSATLTLHAQGSSAAVLLIGSQASTGWRWDFSNGFLELYVAPLVSAPLALRGGIAQVAVNVPDAVGLIGADFALQAVTLGRFDLTASNLLLGNIGARDNGAQARFTPTFRGSAPRYQANKNFAYAGDVATRGGGSMREYSNFGGDHYVTLTVVCGRELRAGERIEIRTGTQGTGTLLGAVTRRSEAVHLRMPAGSVQAPVHVHLHNTDAVSGIDLSWTVSAF